MDPTTSTTPNASYDSPAKSCLRSRTPLLQTMGPQMQNQSSILWPLLLPQSSTMSATGIPERRRGWLNTRSEEPPPLRRLPITSRESTVHLPSRTLFLRNKDRVYVERLIEKYPELAVVQDADRLDAIGVLEWGGYLLMGL